MKAIRIAVFSAVSTLAALCVSCSLLPSGPYHEVCSYDLGIPEATGINISVQPFTADSACKFKMLYRQKGNGIVIDEYNKWTQTPASMITKYLRLAFRNAPDAAIDSAETNPSLSLSGSVLDFEADLDAKKVYLGAQYVLEPVKSGSCPTVKRTLMFSEAFKEDTPDAIAEAMSKAANQLAAAVKKDAVTLSLASAKAVEPAPVAK